MPKLKSNSGAKKRFKITKRGKVLKKRAFARHKLEKKQKSRKMHLRKAAVLNKVDANAIKRMLPYS
ncbi:MAG: 50S ribosomal protein L35 [Candidatus Firestonebacteria bacterium]